MAWVYMVKCSDDSFYVGSAKNLENRLVEHNRGTGARYTARRRPVELVWCADYERVDDAFAMEKQIQGWSRAKRIALIEGRFDSLPALAKRRSGGNGVWWLTRKERDQLEGDAIQLVEPPCEP